jgi:hypothetical protein
LSPETLDECEQGSVTTHRFKTKPIVALDRCHTLGQHVIDETDKLQELIPSQTDKEIGHPTEKVTGEKLQTVQRVSKAVGVSKYKF